MRGGLRRLLRRLANIIRPDREEASLERVSEPQVYMPAAQQRTLLFYAPKDLVIRASVPATNRMP